MLKTSQNLLFLVVIAGGSGTRFWPKSTVKKPKQLLSFGSQDSLLGQTVKRFDSLVPLGQRMIVTTRSLGKAVLEQMAAEGVGAVAVLGEPQGRNTAACVYWAAREVAAKNPDGVMLVMPADHHIAHPEEQTLFASRRK